MAALTAEAGKRLWSFLALHSSQCRDIYWRGPSVDPLLRLVPNPEYRVVLKEFWMLRLINVPKALELRGYPKDTKAELHIEVADDILTANNGRFILHVNSGKAEVAEGGRGDMRIDVRDLAPLYSGMVTPAQLQALGAIEATTEAVTAASALFAGPEPWMPDSF
jgi:predicted acetyltransferase